MNQLIPFNFKNHHIRTVVIDQAPWWVGKDVCDALELSNNRKAITRLEDYEKLTYPLVTSGQTRRMWLVNESGVYSLALTSNKPEAKRFKRWLTTEALPQIRRTGMYVPDDVKDVIKKIPLGDAVPAIEVAMRQDGCSINTIWLVMGIVEILLSHIAVYQAEFELQQELDRCERSKKRATPKDREEIRELYKAGCTKADIKRITYRGRTVINKALRETENQPGLFDDEASESFGKPLVDAARGKGGAV
jgi:hypothetical protein